MTLDIEAQKDAPEPLGCFGICCTKHDTCQLYAAVNGMTRGLFIGTCGTGFDWPMYLEVVKP